jgi:CHAD domain-containing protein
MLAESEETMTTDRTAIRRRLAIRRTAHRPPSRGGKPAGHRSILAPIAATVAATVAVGVGVAIARAGREGRSEHERKPDLRLGLLPGEALPTGLRRMALWQLDGAISQLEGNGIAASPRAVHETRKALKRLRALVRLLEGELGRKEAARESAALASTARLLAGARDAEVLLDTLDRLIARHPGKLARRKSVARLRRRLAAERESAQRRALGDPATRARAIGELRAFRERVLAWDLSGREGTVIVEPGLRRLYCQGRKRCRRVAAGKGERVQEMHEWRKRVKDLRYVTEMLARRGKAAGKGDEPLRTIATRADALGELLGDEHDLAVLAQWIRDNGKSRRTRVGRKTRRTLLGLIERRRRELRRHALREGERLYRDSPKRFLRRVRASQGHA